MPPKLTNPLRPVARYRKGQAPAGVNVASDSDSDSDSDQEQDQVHDDSTQHRQQRHDSRNNQQSTFTVIKQEQDDATHTVKATSGRSGARDASARMDVNLRQVQVDQTGAVKVGGKSEVGRTRAEQEAQDSSSEYGQLHSLARSLKTSYNRAQD